MKNILKNISLGLALTSILISCDSDDDNLVTDVGGYANLTDATISRFDRNSDLGVKFYTSEGVTPESLEIMSDGETLGSGEVSGETASFNSSILGNFTFKNDDGEDVETGSYSIKLYSTYSNGEHSEDPFSVSVEKVVELDEDNPNSTTMDSISTRGLKYSIFTLSASVDNVTLMLKKNNDGTYMDSGINDLSDTEGTVQLGNTDYDDLNLEVNDTLYYKFVATSGSLTDEAESYIEIIPKAFQSTSSAALSNDSATSELNLSSGELYGDDSAEGDIKFLSPKGFEVTGNSDIKFVKVEDDYYDNADVLSAKMEFEDGTPITSATNLADGDTFVYKVSRTGTSYYGVLKIGDITITNDNKVDITVEFGEGI